MILACLSLLLGGCGSGQKADAFAFVSVSYDGYNGNGTVNVRFNEGALAESVMGEEPEDWEELGEWLTTYDNLCMGIDLSVTPRKNLSNGDTVTVVVSVTGEAAKKISGGEMEFQVSGLPEIETVDIFKDIELTYEGIVGDNPYVLLNRLSDSQVLQSCQFSIEPQYGIKNGDTITVTITNSDALAEKFLCIPLETTKTFTVSGLDEYLTDADLLPEDQIREIIAQYVPASQEEDHDFWSYSESVYYKTYFCIGDKGAFGADFNQLRIFICYDAYVNGDYRQTNYVPLIFRDVILTTDGTVALNYQDGYTAVFYTDPDRMVEKMEEDYTVVEVYVEY
jgi:hypothetical protein